ncbi:MAG: GNAT family N-acetyltransferase [Erysipelotrichia bacterium]|nr:GNAT family N-acetyltransferase [Erysipelotrichia bacterium]NCC54580.1 GNAT family N-acetyltransferase [Erysipelotrichia bacterium]
MKEIHFQLITSKVDIHELSVKAAQIWYEHFTAIIGEQQVSYMLNKFLSEEAIQDAILNENYEFYGIYKEKQMIGFFTIHKEQPRLFLSKLYIEKQQRGKGYARQTLMYIEQLMRNNGLTSIWLTCNKYNHDTLAIYQKMGFTIFDEAVNEIGEGYVMDDYYLEKKCF